MSLAEKMTKKMLEDCNLPEFVDTDKLNTIILPFFKEYRKYRHYLSEDSNDKLTSVLPKLFKQFYKINFQKCYVEITQDQSIIFDLELPNQIEYSIELFLNPSEGEAKAVFYSVYHNKKYVANGLTSINKLIDELEWNEYIRKK